MDMKIAPKVITAAAKKAVKSPVVKGAALGAATVKIADAFTKKGEEVSKGSGKTKAIALASTIIGGAAVLFLAGKASGASNKKAISQGLNLVKDGVKKLAGEAKGTPAGEKIANVLGKAKAAADKVKANPTVQKTTEKLKAAGTKVKESKAFQAASEKIKTKASSLKGTFAEKAKGAGAKAKEFLGDKAKAAGAKVKSMIAGLKGKKAEATTEILNETITKIAPDVVS